jgi:hypothetical protein
MMLYGAVVSTPICVPLAKNLTCCTTPSLSDAFALTVMLGGAENDAFSAGLVMATSGGALMPDGTPHASTSIMRL